MLPKIFKKVVFLFVLQMVVGCNSGSSNKSHRHRQKRTLYFTYYAGYALDVVLSLPLELPAGNSAFCSFLFASNFYYPSFDNTNGLIPIPFTWIDEPGVNVGSKFRIELPPAYRQLSEDGEGKKLERNHKTIEEKSAKAVNATIASRKMSSKKKKTNGEKSKNKSRKVRTPMSNYFMSRRRFYKMMESQMNISGLRGHDCLLKAICETSEASFGYNNGVVGSVVNVLFLPSASTAEKLPKRYYQAEENGKSRNCAVYNKECPKEFNSHLELNSHLYPGDGQSKLNYFYDVVKLIKTHVLTDYKNTIQGDKDKNHFS